MGSAEFDAIMKRLDRIEAAVSALAGDPLKSVSAITEELEAIQVARIAGPDGLKQLYRQKTAATRKAQRRRT
jgi:hypothetical protein